MFRRRPNGFEPVFRLQFAVALAAVLLATGCSTKYGDGIGFTGGVDAQRLTDSDFRIMARGNGFTSAATVQDFVLLKAAEVTKRNGGTHFIVGGSANATTAAHIENPAEVRTTYSAGMARSVITPGSTMTIVKPGVDTIIRIISVPTGGRPPDGAISADEIIRSIGPRIQRG